MRKTVMTSVRRAMSAWAGPPAGRMRRLAIVVAAAVALTPAIASATGCLCARKPDKTLALARKVQVGPFTVTFEKMELFGAEAVLSWTSARSMPSAPGSPRNFEFATGRDSFLIATDGLEFGMVKEPSLERTKGRQTGKVTFDAKGLDLAKLAKIEIDGARWVVSTSGDVVVQPDRKINFAVPTTGTGAATVEFTLDTPVVGGGRVSLAAVPTEKPYRQKGAVIGSTARIEGQAPKTPSKTEIAAERQTFTFKFKSLPLLWRVTAVRIDSPGPWVVQLKRTAKPKKAAAPKKAATPKKSSGSD